MLMINIFLLVAGFFLTTSGYHCNDNTDITYPSLNSAGFDPIWFAVVLTINMEIGLNHSASWIKFICN